MKEGVMGVAGCFVEGRKGCRLPGSLGACENHAPLGLSVLSQTFFTLMNFCSGGGGGWRGVCVGVCVVCVGSVGPWEMC